MPLGLITKALSGYYYVLPDEHPHASPIQCRARGLFKMKGLTPLVGDHVVFSETENGEGTVEELLPRSTELIRPPIANVDTALLVFAVTEPGLTLSLLDKFLVHTERAGLQSIICLSKYDLLDNADDELMGRITTIQAYYSKIGYTVLLCSVKTGIGMEEVKLALSGRKTVFSGQSGVGKSSLINQLLPELNIETNEISNRMGRGKHTTRHVEFIRHPNDGWIADTPGFSQLDFTGIEAEELSDCFVEMGSRKRSCKFRGCLHRSEPDCAVIEAVESGAIKQSRFEHYLQFLEEIRERRPRY